MTRVFNFSAGPSALPLPVLEQARDELIDFRGSGASVMEQSHRGPVYDRVHTECVADLRSLLGVPNTHQFVFMGGGARSQFAHVPNNLAQSAPADYLVTGRWAQGAADEAGKLATSRTLYNSKDSGHDHVPTAADFTADAGAAYLHYTSNNTIYGTQYQYLPDAAGGTLVCDMSSDILSRPVDVSRYGLIYAGAQKNMGPAGVTVLIVRSDLLERSDPDMPEMFSFAQIAAKDSMLNTPPTFNIYLVGLVAKWLLGLGGLDAMEARNRGKSDAIYDAIDGSGGFYAGHARADSRSWMNVTFRIPGRPELEPTFVAEATAARMIGLKGHRSVGGLRASIYNAVPPDACAALATFMGNFARRHA
jgi:phosphoserine aminotransferase